MPEVLLVTHAFSGACFRLPRILQKAGCRVSVLTWEPNKLLRSHFVDEHFSVERQAQGGLAGALKTLLEARPDFYHWVIFAEQTILNGMLPYRHQAWLQPWLPVHEDLQDGKQSLEQSLFKADFFAAAKNTTLPIPASQVASTPDAARNAAREIGYPVVVKATCSWGGNGVRRVNHSSAMQVAFDEVSAGQPVVVQSFIKGKMGSTDILFNRGRALAWSPSYLYECFPTDFKPSCARHFSFPDEMRDEMESIVEQIGRLIGFHGLCGFDWVHCPQDNSLQVLEFNPRPTPTLHLAPLCGVDFSAAISALLCDKPQVMQRPRLLDKTPPIVYMYPQHLQRCFNEKRWRELMRWVPGAARNDIPWDEPRLVLQELPRPAIVSNMRTHLKAAFKPKEKRQLEFPLEFP